MGLSNLKARVFSRTGGYRTIFSAGVRTLSQSRCSCRPTPGARMLFVFYPGFRRRGLRLRLRPPRSRLHPGLLSATRWGLRLRLRPPWSRVQKFYLQNPKNRISQRFPAVSAARSLGASRLRLRLRLLRPHRSLGALAIFALVPRAYALGYGAAVPTGLEISCARWAQGIFEPAERVAASSPGWSRDLGGRRRSRSPLRRNPG